MLNVMMIGDVVGDPGLAVLEQRLPGLVREHGADFVVVNGENAADGFGLTKETLDRILAAGADVVTSGNHVWEKRDFWPVLAAERRVLRPANYPGEAPGAGWLSVQKAEVTWLVLNLQGREYMTPIDCPFKSFDNITNIPTNTIVLVDFHAESTREKEALAYYLDGRVSLLAGTHTHVQTADERILPGGTAYITDLGMTGINDSIIGMDPKICLDRARNQVLYRMECAKAGPNGADSAVQGVIAEIDRESGRALSIKRIG
ncbi:2',3'-cyclic-nucleotide 2'-phosphodiesterase [Spirochaetia bacterium]|nr:2',3'-cyclic-nucleotide 2'-phosphodiesterase [Spirochaetia bacterium]